MFMYVYVEKEILTSGTRDRRMDMSAWRLISKLVLYQIIIR